jgi:cytidylate kinase
MKRIVVIEREFGAGATVIAGLVARRLGWKLLDHALTDEIARLARAAPEDCQKNEERVDPWLYRLAKVFWRGSHERSVNLPDAEVVDADRQVGLAEQAILRAAEEGRCVIVGRGAAYFLRDRADTFSVFLYAPRELKYRRVLARVKSETEALHLIDTVDQERIAFIRHYFHAEWPSRHLYHLMLNTAAGEDAAVENILSIIAAADRREAPAS